MSAVSITKINTNNWNNQYHNIFEQIDCFLIQGSTNRMLCLDVDSYCSVKAQFVPERTYLDIKKWFQLWYNTELKVVDNPYTTVAILLQEKN